MKVTPKKKKTYPSAELLIQPCFEDYKYELDCYGKIYDKVNITLAFCGVIFLTILSGIDLNLFVNIAYAKDLASFLKEIYNAFPSISGLLIVIATVRLLKMLRSRPIMLFDSVAFRNDEVYCLSPSCAALAVVDAYTRSTKALREIVQEKEVEYDSIISQVAIAILLYAARQIV